MLDVAIIGIGSIGIVHAAIFESLGANVVAVLSSTEGNANRAARQLRDKYGLLVRPFWNLKEILALPLDAVSICTPPALHYNQILAAFEKGLFVFCEKPLFWGHDSYEETKDKLHHLRSHRNRRLCLNISNTLFIDTIRARVPRPADVEAFKFQFITHGTNRGIDILVDLLPHGISLIQRLFGYRRVSAVNSTILSHKATIAFKYGDCSIHFDFEEDQQSEKKFYFEIDKHQYERIQDGSGNSYRVFIRDVSNNERLELDDPFRVYISRFLDYCRGYPENKIDNFKEAEMNLSVMSTLIRAV